MVLARLYCSAALRSLVFSDCIRREIRSLFALAVISSFTSMAKTCHVCLDSLSVSWPLQSNRMGWAASRRCVQAKPHECLHCLLTLFITFHHYSSFFIAFHHFSSLIMTFHQLAFGNDSINPVCPFVAFAFVSFRPLVSDHSLFNCLHPFSSSLRQRQPARRS